MTKKILIDFDIFSTDETDDFSEIEYVVGGLRICVDGIVITKYQNDPADPGFRYDSLYYLILGILRSIPSHLLKNEPVVCRFIDSIEGFVFSPEGDQTRVKFRHLWDPSSTVLEEENGIRNPITVEEVNKRYPDYPDGTLVPTRDLIDALIGVSEKFVQYLKENVHDQNDELDELTMALDEAKESVRNF